MTQTRQHAHVDATTATTTEATPGALRYGLQVHNPLDGQWHTLPGYSAPSMSEAILFGMSHLEPFGYATKPLPLVN